MSQFCATSLRFSDLFLVVVGGAVVLNSMVFHLTRPQMTKR